MSNPRRLLRTLVLLGSVLLCSGCLSQYRGFLLPKAWFSTLPISYSFQTQGSMPQGGLFPLLLTPIPVSPALSQEIEDHHERRDKEGVPILGPIRGEFAPVFCMDPPSDEEVYQTLPPIVHGLPFVWEVQRKNVRISKEKLVDHIDDCRFYPLIGPCQLHHCHFKCTVWFEETTTMAWPIPWTHTVKNQEVLYIDKDHLHRCGEAGHLASASGPSTVSPY